MHHTFFQGRPEAFGKKDNSFAQFQTLKLFFEIANIKKTPALFLDDQLPLRVEGARLTFHMSLYPHQNSSYE